MKKCPVCKSEIQEEARFCLYCMTSFEEKESVGVINKKNRKWWLAALAVVLVVISIVFSVLISSGKEMPHVSASESTQTITTDVTVGGTASSEGVSNQPAPQSQSANSTDKRETTPPPTNNNKTQETTKKENSTTPVQNTISNSDDSAEPTENKVVVTQPKYEYVAATLQNAYPTGYSAMYAPDNAIVITQVNYREESGNYYIPDTIDGKKVAAIMPSAFSDPSVSSVVKSVTLPATVRTIWGSAFKNCYNLRDIYIKSGVIAIYTDAFPATSMRTGTLTIHCARDCRNFDFYYYRNIAGNYGAEYAQWNG